MSADGAALVAALLAAEAVPARMFVRSPREGLRDVEFADQSWSLNEWHGIKPPAGDGVVLRNFIGPAPGKAGTKFEIRSTKFETNSNFQ